MSRQDDFLKIVNMFSNPSGMNKTAQGAEMAGQPLPAQPMPMGMVDPYAAGIVMPPPVETMVPPPPEQAKGKNENDVAIKAMDLAAKTIEYALADEEKEPEEMTDEAAAILAGSKALDAIPSEDIANMAEGGQLPPEEQMAPEAGQQPIL